MIIIKYMKNDESLTLSRRARSRPSRRETADALRSSNAIP